MIEDFSIFFCYQSLEFSDFNYFNAKCYNKVLTDTGEDSKLVHRLPRATSMSQRRVETTRVHFWTFSLVSVSPKLRNM